MDRMIHVRLDDETYRRLQDLAQELRSEQDDYRLGVSTLVLDILKRYVKEQEASPAEKSKPPKAARTR